METRESQPDGRIESETHRKQRKNAINQLVFGSIILLWGSLQALKEAGIIQKNVSTWPFPLTALGTLLVAVSIYRLSRPRRR